MDGKMFMYIALHKDLLYSKNKTLFYSISVSFIGRGTAHIFKEVSANTFHSFICFRSIFLAPDDIFFIKSRPLQHSNAVTVKLKIIRLYTGTALCSALSYKRFNKQGIMNKCKETKGDQMIRFVLTSDVLSYSTVVRVLTRVLI